jgi:hypothetical protein
MQKSTQEGGQPCLLQLSVEEFFYPNAIPEDFWTQFSSHYIVACSFLAFLRTRWMVLLLYVHDLDLQQLKPLIELPHSQIFSCDLRHVHLLYEM